MTTGLGSLVQAQWNDPVEAVEHCYALGWTDGLPVVPPTVQRVQEFLDVGQRPADEVIGSLPERRREVTVGKVAANAVMAGCKPEYFPVVLATAEAMLDPKFNLIGPSSSLGGAGILVIVNGPAASDLSINSRNNLFGPGNRANATIGRAVRLILMNTCAAIPGLFDRTVLGHPGKYSYCIAENESASSWTPLHVERGFNREDSTVTVFACEGPRQVRASNWPETMLYAVADTISGVGTSMASAGSVGDTSNIVRQGEVALVFAGTAEDWDGWTKDDIRRYLHPMLKLSFADLKRGGVLEGSISDQDEKDFLQLILSPDDIMIVFAGGAEQPHIAAIPSWGPKVSSESVTRKIQWPTA